MSPVALSLISIALLAAQNAAAQQSTFPPTPLADKRFASPTALPFKVDTDTNLLRGVQHGYNICNSTTEGPNSLCQTSYLNGPDDWCLWAPSEPGSEVFDKEGEMVAWCTKPGKGTRLIPSGAILGFQFMETPDYIQVVGRIDQDQINLIRGHFGGEMDPHGADLRGNPMGGVVFSNFWSGGNANDYKQVVEWHNFMGGDQFCFKACKEGPNQARFCEHRFDRIGCEFNAPNELQLGQFMSCKGENQDFPGTYTSNGQVMTYTQPDEALGPITTQPYVVRMPKSSDCVTYESSKIFAAIATVTGSVPPLGASSTGVPAPSGGSSTGGAAGTSPRPTGGASPTSSGAAPSGSNTAETLAISGVASFFGVIVAALFLS